MNYYSLTLPSDPKIIGVKNGITQAEVEMNKHNNGKIWNRLFDFFETSKYWEQKKYIPEFDFAVNVKLLKGAKVTDFLQFSPALFSCPFLIHKKVADVFRKLKLSRYELYPATVYDVDDNVYSHEYFLICCPFLGYETINFEKSIFFTGNNLLGKKYHNFRHEEDFVAFVRKYSVALGAEKLVLNNNFDSTLDLFVSRIGGMHVSEALKEAIEILEFSGVKLISDYRGKIVVQ